jgi:hypothetical protein
MNKDIGLIKAIFPPIHPEHGSVSLGDDIRNQAIAIQTAQSEINSLLNATSTPEKSLLLKILTLDFN